MPKIIFSLVTLLALSSCKLATIVVEGGQVQSSISGLCSAGSVCVQEIYDTNFAAAYTAQPNTGWQFLKWRAGDKFLCANSTNAVCVVDNTFFAGDANAEAIVASDEVYYVMPIFVEVGLPITDTVVVNGREWAQVDLFTNLSWNKINSVCHGGPCNGVLNGHDMENWNWAKADDVNQLFNFYGVTVPLTGQNAYSEKKSAWAPAFFNGRIRPTASDTSFDYVDGWTSEYAVINPTNGFARQIQDYYSFDFFDIAGARNYAPTRREAYLGGWFYRDP